MFTRNGMPVFPERLAPTDVILPQARLGFVDAQGHRRAQRRAEMLCRQPLLIQAVPGFMQNPIERLREVGFVVAGGQSAIIDADPAAEWMGGGVNAPGGEVKA